VGSVIPHYPIDPIPCPRCGRELNDIACTNRAVTREPRVGDVAVCFVCAEILEFIDGRTVKKAELDTIGRLDLENRVALHLARLRVIERNQARAERN
jgi:hypothetical protein